MFQIKHAGPVGYEDLMRELSIIEQTLIKEDSSIAMDLMVLEAKIRERFQRMEGILHDKSGSPELAPLIDEISLEDIQTLIPQELPPFPSLEQFGIKSRRKKVRKTIGLAAVLAVLTALGVFGLASILQFALTWLI